jgi:glycogen debranching enzyme
VSDGSTQASPWVFAREPSSLGDPTDVITLVDGQTFSLSSRSGDYGISATNGVFFADMRVLSRARLLVAGSTIESLAVSYSDSSGATFVGRSVPTGVSDARLLVIRRRSLGSILHEEIEFRNTSAVPVSFAAELEVAADFASVFAIKEGHVVPVGEHSVEVRDQSLLFGWRLADIHRQAELITVGGTPPVVTSRGFGWSLHLEPQEVTSVGLHLAVALGDEWVEREQHHPRLPNAATRNRTWLAAAPRLRTANRALSTAFDRSIDDIAALRLHDPSGQRKPVIAAGAPWYMTLFGRDGLISSYMTIPVDPTLAIGVLEALAELQGTRVDDTTEEQPGRILHETRYLGVAAPTLTGGSTYYGSADATPLFVMLLGELSRWGLDDDTLDRLLPHADRALRWIEEFGDRDGDGYVEYERSSDRGLVNQGWKDSVDAIRFRDGRFGHAPIALCEVQAYVYGAYCARAEIADRMDDADVATHYRERAARLQEQFAIDFWVAEHEWFAVGLDADKRQIDSLTSNIGHCLWTGIALPEHAAAVTRHLLSPAMWTGWGIRTMADGEVAYDPMSYHCGTVWPHDGALCAAGMRAYGFSEEALTVANGLLAAAKVWDGRLPELFSGLDREDVGTPVPVPTSCSPQAWAAATPFLLLRIMLGLEPDERGAGIVVTPMDGAIEDDLVVRGLHTLTGRFDVRIDDGIVAVTPSE